MLKTEVDFLGFHIHKDGISPRAAKVRVISELPEPRNAKEAKATLSLFGFFRRHIENYAEKTYHLSKESIGKNKKTLSDESLKEFNNLKKGFEGEKNGIADFLSQMKKNPNLCIEEINDICYLREDGFKKLIIIDKETIHTIIREYHDTKYSCHHALDITYNNIRQDYYFKEMFSIIKKISIDFLSLPKTTYALNGFTVEVDQVCVIVCRLSKMVHIVPCHKTIDAEHAAQLLLNHVFRLHGYPRTIVSYRDPRFLSDIRSRWANTMDSKLKMTVAHRAQADGQTERMNR
ncbi:hypothetical protein ACTFIY_008892 [Dictyostelium cf. discoideum]